MSQGRRARTPSAPTLFFCLLAAAEQVYGAAYSFASQPPQTSLLNNFEIAGNSYASAQQVCVSPARVSSALFEYSIEVFLGTLDKVYIVDKTENNAQQINGHPAWAAGGCPPFVCSSSLHAAPLQNGPQVRSRQGQWI